MKNEILTDPTSQFATDFFCFRLFDSELKMKTFLATGTKRVILNVKNGLGVNRMWEQSYFLPLLACLAGRATCFFSFRFCSFSRIIFLCCSKPSAFFAFLDNIFNLSLQ